VSSGTEIDHIDVLVVAEPGEVHLVRMGG